MTSPAKPPAPMEPLKPCPWCGTVPVIDEDTDPPTVECLEIDCTGQGVYCVEDWNNRRAAPSPSDGEVGELVKDMEYAIARIDSEGGEWDHFKWCRAWLEAITPRWRKMAAALSRQSAELAEAREAVRLQRERLDEYAADADRDFTLAVRCERAESALLAVGCKPGPEGWMRPIYKCIKCGIGDRCECETSEIDYLPIPGAGAKGETK